MRLIELFITDSPEFQRWYAGSKLVDGQGRFPLFEDRLAFLKTRYIPLLMKYIEEAQEADDPRFHNQYAQLQDNLGRDKVRKAFPEETAEHLFDYLVRLDPSPTKKYAQWLLNTFLKVSWQIDDGYKATEYLTLFSQIAPGMPAAGRDINRYKSPRDLFDAMRPYRQVQSQRSIGRAHDVQMHEQARVVLNNAHYKIVVPLTMAASCHFGIHTQWCTAAAEEEDNAFDNYYRDGDLYIILDKASNQRWQFHFEMQQFMDENDREISTQDFIQDHPELAEFFAQLDQESYFGEAGKAGHIVHVYRTPRGLILKSKPGLSSILYGYVTTDNAGKVDSVRFYNGHDTISEEKLAGLLNKAGFEGGSDKMWFDIYYRAGQWGSIAQIGGEVAQVEYLGQPAVWKGLEDDAGWHFTLSRHDQPLNITANLINHSGFWVFNDSEEGLEADGHILSTVAMPLVKATPEIQYWHPEMCSFDSLLPQDKNWIAKNRPTFVTPGFAFDNYNATIYTKAVIGTWLDQAYLRPMSSSVMWLGDTAIIRGLQHSLENDVSPVGSIISRLGLWEQSANTDALWREAPFVRYIDDGKIKAGLNPDQTYVLAIPLKVLGELMKRPFDDYKGITWVDFLEPLLPRRRTNRMRGSSAAFRHPKV